MKIAMKKIILLISTVLLLLAAAYSLGEITYFLRGIMQRTYNLTPLAGIAVGNIIFSCALLLAISSIRKQISNSKMVASAYIIAGLIASFSMLIYYLFPGLPSSVSLISILSPESHISMAGALMVALGLSAFLPTRKQA